MVGIVRRVGAHSPEAELPRPRRLGENLKPPRVSPPATPVEVGRGRTDRNEADAHVERAVNAHDVAQEAAVVVNAVRRRFCEQAHSRSDREQRLRRA